MTRTKRTVLFVDNSYTFGGAVLALSSLVEELHQSGYECIVVSGQNEKALKQKFPFIQIYSLQLKLPWVHKHTYDRFSRSWLFKFRIPKLILLVLRTLYWWIFHFVPQAFKYARIGKRHNVDIIHANNDFITNTPAFLAGLLLRTPTVSHNRDFCNTSGLESKLHAIFPTSFIAVSNAIKNDLIKNHVPSEKINLLLDSINLQGLLNLPVKEQPPETENLSLGFFGRLVPWKGADIFIEAVSLLKNRNIAVDVLIVGDQSDGDAGYLHYLHQKIESHGLQEQVSFTGYQTDITPYIAQIDMLIHASTRPEPFGLVIIEGMAAGKAVIATQGGGPDDIIVHNGLGTLVAPNDALGIANAVEAFDQDRVRMQKIQLNSRDYVSEKFDIKDYRDSVERIYQSIWAETQGC